MRMRPPLRQTVGCSALGGGRGRNLGKQPPLCAGDGQTGDGGGLGAAVPTAHSVSVTGVREFNSQHANHVE